VARRPALLQLLPLPRALPLVLGALLSLGVACGDAGSEAQAPPPSDGEPAFFAGANLVIISIDTLRADDTGFVGGAAGLTEALDALAARSVVFTQARASAPQTAPSHMSLFTGVAPSVHGVQNVQHGVDPETGKKRPLIEAAPLEIPTLAEVLRAAGYATVGLTDGGNLNPPHGFGRGFDEYTSRLTGAAAQVADGLERLASLRAAEGPSFLFLHTYQVHSPYVAPREYLERWAPAGYEGLMRERVEHVAGMGFGQAFGAMRTVYWQDKQSFGWNEAAYLHGVYRAGIEQTDDALLPFLDALEQSGAMDDSIVVLLSDHGEEFFEHGQWQHDQLFEECLRVPLMVHLPGDLGAGRRIEVPVSLLDVMPTLLELLELERDPAGDVRVPMRGVSFARSLTEGTPPRERPLFSEYRADRPGSPLYDWQIAIHHRGAKFIYDEYRQKHWWGAGKAPRSWRDHWLFDLDSDALERVNLAAAGDPMVASFERQLAAYKRELEAMAFLERLDAGEELDPDQLEQLIQLGYLDR